MAAQTPHPGIDAQVRLDTLLDAVRRLSLAKKLEQVQEITTTAARKLANADGTTFVLREGSNSFYADEDAISPLWKGQRFPLTDCISGWSMINRTPVVIEDIYADERVPHDPYRPTFVKSLAMVPIRTLDPLGAIGIYWVDHHRATDEEVGAVRALADSAAVALEHIQMLKRLEWTAHLAETDALTELPNRRAWDVMIEGALGPSAGPSSIAIIGLDGFKAVNDREGRESGDELLQRSAAAWRETLRKGDVVARFGGDEFAVLMSDCSLDQAASVVDRLRRLVPRGKTASAGIAQWDGSETARSLVARADSALYEAKRSGRDRSVCAD